MQLVEHDALQRAEQKRRVVGWTAAAPAVRAWSAEYPADSAAGAAARGRRVAGAGLDLDRQPISAIGVSRLRAMSTASALSGEM
jgi:hypothetical protein